MSTVTISGLLIYPVKSMRGISLERATLTARGLDHDRQWMVVDPRGRFVTQKDKARLALVQTTLTDDGVERSMQGKGSVHLPHAVHMGDPDLTASLHYHA